MMSDEMGSKGAQDESEETPDSKVEVEEVDSPISEDAIKNGVPFPPLETWTLTDLERVRDDPEMIDALVMTSSFVVGLENQKTDLLAENRRLAEINLDCEKAIDALSKELNLRHDSIRNLFENVESSSLTYAKLAEAYSPNNIRESLQKSVLHIDEESERVAEEFLQKRVDVEEFINDYTEKRKLSHIRKVKCEKLGNQLKKFEQAGL